MEKLSYKIFILSFLSINSYADYQQGECFKKFSMGANLSKNADRLPASTSSLTGFSFNIPKEKLKANSASLFNSELVSMATGKISINKPSPLMSRYLSIAHKVNPYVNSNDIKIMIQKGFSDGVFCTKIGNYKSKSVEEYLKKSILKKSGSRLPASINETDIPVRFSGKY